MAEFPSTTDASRITTLRSLLGAGGGVESPGLEAAPDPAHQKVAERYNSVVEKLAAEAAKSGERVLITVQDRDASMLQSRLAEDGEAGPPLPAGGVEAQFGEGIWGGDVCGHFFAGALFRLLAIRRQRLLELLFDAQGIGGGARPEFRQGMAIDGER